MYKLSSLSKDNIPRILVMACVLIMFSCTSNEEVTLENDVKSKTTIEQSANMSRRWCPDGFVGQWTFDYSYELFKKTDPVTKFCKDGFGFCFNVGVSWTFNCVRAPQLTMTRVSFNPVTGIASVDGIVNNDNTISFYFHKDIANGGGYGPNYYSVLDIGVGSYLDASTMLTAGIYPRSIIGNYYVYRVPFTIL